MIKGKPMADLKKLNDEMASKIQATDNLANLEQLKVEIFGKSGALQAEMAKIATLPTEERKDFGREVNIVKQSLQGLFDQKKEELHHLELDKKLQAEWQDLSLPGRRDKIGKIHPLTQALNEMTEIFANLGFNIEEGPSIEEDWYNFTALNIDENHPARQMHDTFYMKEIDGSEAGKTLLRTHTSPVQIRTMQKGKPPFRFVVPGRVYRCDWDATHTPMFHQIEGVVVDKDIHMGHLKHFITEFMKAFFEKDKLDARFRGNFFPFTEPSAEVDIRCSRKSGELVLGEGDDWLEVMGCGMIHPKVLENAGIDPQEYQGFAFGLGVERFAMLKYGIADLREFFAGDVRWLNHYGFSSFDVPSLIGGLTR
ncbi:MAG: pheS [Rickettsiaceae bacterium]|jgi:phenylalanyl-tRNA synthetase alpha chain|nr:pheS [Rickettsiaceae bacterium]